MEREDGPRRDYEPATGIPELRVAVVAVHGVANQQPGETARHCADLLLRSGPEGSGGGYRLCREEGLRIRVDELDCGQAAPRRWWQRWSFLSESVSATLSPSSSSPPPGEGSASQLSLQALKDQLAGVGLPPSQRVWQTLRLEAESGQPECEGEGEEGVPPHRAHVYEMYWADLSRLGNSLLGAFFSFYQLLFFLPGLGLRTLGQARAELQRQTGNGSPLWLLYGTAHALATRVLVLGVPVLNLGLLALASVLIVRAVELQQPSGLPWMAAVLFGLFPLALCYTLRSYLARWWFLSLPLAGALVWWWRVEIQRADSALFWSTVALWVAVVSALLVLFWQYAERYPGAFVFGAAGLAAFTVIYLTELQRACQWDSVFDAAHETATVVLRHGHWWLWGLFSAFALAASLLGFLAVRSCVQEHRDSARRAAWTADLSLALPGAMVLVVNLGLWTALAGLAGRTLGPTPSADPSETPILTAEQLDKVDGLLRNAIPPYFEWGLWTLAVAFGLALWWLLPAVLADRWIGRWPLQFVDKTPSVRLEKRLSVWLGESLTAAFRLLRLSGELIRWLVCLGLTASVVVALLDHHHHWPLGLPEPPLTLIGAVGVGLAAALLGTGRAGFLSLGFRSALDVALDVANWLRHDPPGKTPSGRIASRYRSLLRYLEEWRHPVDGGGYGAVILLAHSQGAVVTADLLRLLNAGSVASPLRVPIYLLTMGCPLQQLYGLRFPHRYHWSWNTEPWKRTRASNPQELGVAHWRNCYRSGDFVGRYLWHPWGGAPAASFEPGIDVTGQERRSETCLEAGAHNRYLDGSSPEVGRELRRLIAMACKAAGARTAHERNRGRAGPR